MESEACLDETRNKKDSSWEKAPLAIIRVFESVNFERIADGKATAGSITPDSDRENGEVQVDFKSPVTWVSSLPRTDEVAGSDLSPKTPKKDVFDPFAPGPEELMLAPPPRKRFLEESRDLVSRRLNFDSSAEPKEAGKVVSVMDSVQSLSEEQIFLKTMYESIMEAVLSQQVEALDGSTAETMLVDTDCEGLSTPKSSLPLLSGVAETCPGAPVKGKLTGKLRHIDRELCRKLEF